MSGKMYQVQNGVKVDITPRVASLTDTSTFVPRTEFETAVAGLVPLPTFDAAVADLEAQIAAAGGGSGVADFYVDATNGDDTKDGRTQATAVQTLDKAIELMQNATAHLNNLYIAGGSYTAASGQFSFADCATVAVFLQGDVTFNGSLAVTRAFVGLNGSATAPNVTISGGIQVDYGALSTREIGTLALSNAPASSKALVYAAHKGYVLLRAEALTCVGVQGANDSYVMHAVLGGQIDVGPMEITISGYFSSNCFNSVYNGVIFLKNTSVANPKNITISASASILFYADAGSCIYCAWYGDVSVTALRTSFFSSSTSSFIQSAMYGTVRFTTSGIAGFTAGSQAHCVAVFGKPLSLTFSGTGTNGQVISSQECSYMRISANSGITLSVSSGAKQYTAVANTNSVLRCSGTFTSVGTYAAGRYNANTGGQIIVGGSATYFPGNVNGTTATGGYYS